jgi:4-diphosphocytidyl-2-C-methyl-D-erythritol kinase
VPVTVRVPAKVNLYLGVGPKRDDGFHDLATVFQAVSLYDEVTVRLADPFGEEDEPAVTVTVEGEGCDSVPTGEDNLAVRAVRALADHVDLTPAVHLTLRKGIPVAGGMAGGSADAAAALVACDTLWGTGLERSELATLAASLGSDVPFTLTGGTALGTGRGERLTPVLARGTYHWVFALAEGGLSTPAVYAELDRQREETGAEPAHVPEELMGTLRSADASALGTELFNALQPAALRLHPQLRRTLQAGRELGALGAMVCGSGPTCAFLARDESHAVGLAAELAGAGVCRSVRRAHGPVPGARVVEQ